FWDPPHLKRKPSSEITDQRCGIPRPRTLVMDVTASDRRATLHPVDQRVALTPWHLFDAFDDRALTLCNCRQRLRRPPRQMIWWRIEQEIGDSGQRRRNMRDANDHQSARAGRLQHIREELGR